MRGYDLEWFIISICGIAKSLIISATCLDDKHGKRLSKVTSPMQIIINTYCYAPFICELQCKNYQPRESAHLGFSFGSG